MRVNTQSNNNFYLELIINNQTVLLSLCQVEIVLPMVELQSIPDKNHLLKGILNYHGTAIPVYDLAELLELSETETNINTPLILVDMNQTQQVGMFLKEVLDVIEIEETAFQQPKLSNVKSFVSGIYETNAKNAWRLDLSALFQYHNLGDEEKHVSVN